MKQTKSILILSVSAGSGHIRAAQALFETISLEYPSYSAVHIDVMDLVQKVGLRRVSLQTEK